MVENLEKSQEINIELLEVSDLFNIIQSKEIIGHFNGFWPKYDALEEWIHQKWTSECDIYFCAKGFFCGLL